MCMSSSPSEAAGEHFSPCLVSDGSSWSFLLLHCSHSVSPSLFFASVKSLPHTVCFCVEVYSYVILWSCALPLQKDRGEPLVSTCERKSFWCRYVVPRRAACNLECSRKGFLIPRNCLPKIIESTTQKLLWSLKAVTRWQTLIDTCKDPCKILKLSLAGECARTEIPRLPFPLSEWFAPHAELITSTYWVSSPPFCRN